MNVLKEPLLHFLLIGAALFLLFDWKGNAADGAGGQAGTPAAQIVVSRDVLEQLRSSSRGPGSGRRPRKSRKGSSRNSSATRSTTAKQSPRDSTGTTRC